MKLNFSNVDVAQFLKDQGIKYDKVNGRFLIQYEGKKVPSIKYDVKDDVIIVSFQSKYDSFGRISVPLDYVNFVFFYDKNDIDIFLEGINNDYLKLVISLFNLNPSIIKKAISKKNKKSKLRLNIKEKCAKLFLNGKE